MSVGRQSLVLAPFAIAARGVAFFIPAFLARWFGVDAMTDAFYYALGTSNFLLVLGAVAVGTVLVPALADLRARAPERQGPFLGAAAGGSMVGAVIIGGAAAITFPLLLPRITRFDPATQVHAARFAWELVPFVAVVAFNAVVRAAVEVHGRYVRSAVSPVVRTIALLAVARMLRDSGPTSLPVAMAVGAVAEAGWLLISLRGTGIHPLPRLALPAELKLAGLALVPVLVGESMVALNVWVDRLFAGALGEGTVSMLEYADRARVIPQTLLEGSLLVVAFNTWARARAAGAGVERHRAVATTIWWVALLSPPVLAGMFVGRVALIRLLFEGGAFTAAYTLPTAAALGAFLPGVYCSLLGALVVKAHIIERRYGLVMRLGAVSLLLNLVLDFALFRRFGLPGLAAATSLTNLVAAGLAFHALLPELRGQLPARAVLLVPLGLALAVLLALPSVTAPPASVADPRLWLTAVPFLALLAAAAWRARRAP